MRGLLSSVFCPGRERFFVRSFGLGLEGIESQYPGAILSAGCQNLVAGGQLNSNAFLSQLIPDPLEAFVT